ncbi:hypothetical protein [Apibacter sp. ESL0404]|uniref:hypothetical protein n=1 Tax=Apibacter sp. ESL0404 TaxID=2704651 RepID=UPI001C6A1FD8|nr:hypothetical protein [Apibacter sp. ESL0404]QYN51092.1 hypothetical protein GYM72_05905 [Apibacter sp. ESL0404]
MAQVNAETGFFKLSQEKPSKYKSGTSFYKGRGLIQLTGNLNKDGTAYSVPGPYEKYGKYLADNGYLKKEEEGIFISDPDLISKDLHYAIDSAGWEWCIEKKALSYIRDYGDKEKNEYAKWKRDTFPKGVGKSLNDIALAYEETIEEEKYFWFQSKILNGYPLTHKDKPDPHGWEKRKEGLRKLKTWFKYDKAVCRGEKEINYNKILDNPMLNYVKVAGSFIGIEEGNNSIIANFFTEIGHKGYTDKTAWCAAFVNYCLKIGNPEIPRKDALNAVSFSYSGYEEVDIPFYGSFMVWAKNGTFYKVGSQGHVAIVVGKVENAYAQLGGNQAKPGKQEGTTVNVVLRQRDPKVKYFHPKQVPKIELGEPLFTPATKTAGKESLNSTR